MAGQTAAGRGAEGERLAAAHYRAKGYRVLAANYRTRFGELDLVVEKNGTLAFVEVKTRGENRIAAPREWVDARKQRRIILAAQQFIFFRKLGEPFMRFDVVEVILPQAGAPEVTCIENAFTL